MITGSEDQHFEVRATIVTYMPNIAHFLLKSPYFTNITIVYMST